MVASRRPGRPAAAHAAAGLALEMGDPAAALAALGVAGAELALCPDGFDAGGTADEANLDGNCATALVSGQNHLLGVAVGPW